MMWQLILITVLALLAGLCGGFVVGMRFKNDKLLELNRDLYDAAYALLPKHCVPKFDCVNCQIIQLHSEKVVRDVMCRVIQEEQ